MKFNSQDAPKAVALVVLIVVVAVLAYSRVAPYFAAETPKPKPVVTNLTAEPSAAPTDDPMRYAMQIEAWSQPPAAPAGNPFREVLPRTVARVERSVPPAVREIGGSGFEPFGVGSVPGAAIGFPEIAVKGVLIGKTSADTFAVVVVDGREQYAYPGQSLGEALTVVNVNDRGVWVQAAKERAFIGVNRTYRPTGAAAS